MDVQPALSTLVERGKLPPRDDWEGVADADLRRLVEKLRHPLPAAYETVLRLVGRCVRARLFEGSDFFWPNPLYFTEMAIEEYDGLSSIGGFSADSTIVLMHQGYLMFWCRPEFDGQADPPVYGWPNPGSQEPTRVADRFTDWLLQFAK